MSELKLTSPAFKPGDWMPNHASAYYENRSPELNIEGIDPRGVSLVITMDDQGHPLEPGYNHWVAWNIPVNGETATIPEGIPQGAVLDEPIHIEQGMAYGKHCYKGPKPPFNWNHDYLFTLYVIDIRLELSPDSKRAAVLKAIEGHVLQTATLTGKYQRRHG